MKSSNFAHFDVFGRHLKASCLKCRRRIMVVRLGRLGVKGIASWSYHEAKSPCRGLFVAGDKHVCRPVFAMAGGGA